MAGNPTFFTVSPVITGNRARLKNSWLDPNSMCERHDEGHNISVGVILRWFTRFALGFRKKRPNLEVVIPYTVPLLFLAVAW